MKKLNYAKLQILCLCQERDNFIWHKRRDKIEETAIQDLLYFAYDYQLKKWIIFVEFYFSKK